MYKIVFAIPCHDLGGGRIAMPNGLARDLLTQVKYEPHLRVFAIRARSIEQVYDPVEVNPADHQGFSFAFLPWDGGRRSLPMALPAIRSMLKAEAADSTVWHSNCSLGLFDLNTIGYAIGRRRAPGLRIFCLDSDPVSMLRGSGGLASAKASLLRRSLIRRVEGADVTIVVGRGVEETYRRYARRCIATEAVWLMEGDLAEEGATRAKFAESGPVRIALPSRLTAWKGVDDAIRAVALLGDRVGPFRLDIFGDGDQKEDLSALVRSAGVGDRVRFLPSLPYGEPFFRALREYHLVLVPTRGLEEARIVYDAAASGCLLVHSRTRTLEAALDPIPLRWSHEPGDVASLADSIAAAIGRRPEWAEGALAGIRAMQGRTIEEMHRKRSEFLKPLRADPTR